MASQVCQLIFLAACELLGCQSQHKPVLGRTVGTLCFRAVQLMGYALCPRAVPLVDSLISNQDAQGRYIPERASEEPVVI